MTCVFARCYEYDENTAMVMAPFVLCYAVQVPDGMDPVTAAPLMCAGVTVFHGLRSNIEKALPPAIVAVVG